MFFFIFLFSVDMDVLFVGQNYCEPNALASSFLFGDTTINENYSADRADEDISRIISATASNYRLTCYIYSPSKSKLCDDCGKQLAIVDQSGNNFTTRIAITCLGFVQRNGIERTSVSVLFGFAHCARTEGIRIVRRST